MRFLLCVSTVKPFTIGTGLVLEVDVLAIFAIPHFHPNGFLLHEETQQSFRPCYLPFRGYVEYVGILQSIGVEAISSFGYVLSA
jgi:hypothetical protein